MEEKEEGSLLGNRMGEIVWWNTDYIAWRDWVEEGGKRERERKSNSRQRDKRQDDEVRTPGRRGGNNCNKN